MTRQEAVIELQKFLHLTGKKSSNYDADVEEVFVAQDDPYFAHNTYEAIIGKRPIHPDLPTDTFIVWAKVADKFVPADSVKLEQ